MRQAIVTKYIGPTNFRGSRVKAWCEAGSVTLSWDDALDVNGNHTAAARRLATQLGWAGHYVGGGLPTKQGNCYVLVSYFIRAGVQLPSPAVESDFTVTPEDF